LERLLALALAASVALLPLTATVLAPRWEPPPWAWILVPRGTGVRYVKGIPAFDGPVLVVVEEEVRILGARATNLTSWSVEGPETLRGDGLRNTAFPGNSPIVVEPGEIVEYPVDPEPGPDCALVSGEGYGVLVLLTDLGELPLAFST